MILLLTKIKWDTDGESLKECRLPENVIVVGLPNPYPRETVSQQFIDDIVAEKLTESFGFCHDGFQWEVLNETHDTHTGGGFYPDMLGVIRI